MYNHIMEKKVIKLFYKNFHKEPESLIIDIIEEKTGYFRSDIMDILIWNEMIFSY